MKATDRHTAQADLPFPSMTLHNLVANALRLLRDTQPHNGYTGAFSGGKDSIVIKRLAKLACVDVRWLYNVTTIDPPELVTFIRTEHPDVTFRYSDKPFFSRMVEKGFPTRKARWCCQEYKESRIDGTCIFGIRWAESPRRKKQWRGLITVRSGGWALCPILHWTDEQVWRFIRAYNEPYSELYDEGFERLGCIGCPMAGKAGREREFKRWPNYARAWRNAFHALWERRTETPKKNGLPWCGNFFKDADELFEWWLGNEPWPGNNPDMDNDTETEGCQGLLF